MGKIFESIDDKLAAWIGKQHLFFVSTAPLAGDGKINCSPKGMGGFRICSPNEVAYGDLNGSGIETAAHLNENGRILIMFCAFEGAPRIVRLHGHGRYLKWDSPEFAKRQPDFGVEGLRGIVQISLTRISDSCGYGVPRYEFIEQRETLEKWCQQKTPEEMIAYQQKKNAVSIDGLPGI